MTRCGYCWQPMDEHLEPFDCALVLSRDSAATLWIVTSAFLARATFPC